MSQNIPKVTFVKNWTTSVRDFGASGPHGSGIRPFLTNPPRPNLDKIFIRTAKFGEYRRSAG